MNFQHREGVEEGVKLWVQEVSKDNPFGAILVHNQIIPFTNSTGTQCSIIEAAYTLHLFDCDFL